MKQYLDLLSHVLHKGEVKDDRTGTGTKSVFGWQMRFDLNDGIPLLTTKRLHLKSIIYELLWFIKGDTNISYLKKHNVSIWDEWADKKAKGDGGSTYDDTRQQTATRPNTNTVHSSRYQGRACTSL